MDAANLDQLVTEATHDKRHTLDLVITRREESALVSNLAVRPLSLSDHDTIAFNLPWKGSLNDKRMARTRNIKGIDINAFRSDLEQCDIVKSPPCDLDALVDAYNTDLRGVLDKHAPEKEKVVVLRPHAPWYTEQAKQAKRERRKAERRWGKSDKLEIDREILKNKQKQANEICSAAKRGYYNSKVSAAEGDSKELFRVVNALLHKPKGTPLPSHTSDKEMANMFGQFFSKKISKIRDVLTLNNNDSEGVGEGQPCLIPRLESFTHISESDIGKIIMKGNSKSCALDPVPTSLVKQILPLLLPSICKIVNEPLLEVKCPMP